MNPHAERLTDSKFLPRWLVHEHQARYAFCRARVADKLVLDCGSGEGKGALAMAEGRPNGLVALDRSLPAVAMARAPRVMPVAAEAEWLAIRSKAVDVVVALEVIEHMTDPDTFVREAARVLRDGGTFICSTPNRTVRNPRLPLSGRPLNPWHLREWIPQEFRSMLSAAFDRVELFGQEPQSLRTTRLFAALSRIISRRGAAIVRQLAKLGLMVASSTAAYEVAALRDGFDYEFIVAVCSAPRTPSTEG